MGQFFGCFTKYPKVRMEAPLKKILPCLPSVIFQFPKSFQQCSNPDKTVILVKVMLRFIWLGESQRLRKEVSDHQTKHG